VIKDKSIMGQPVFEGTCVGCGKCLLICPGLAISLVDFRKDSQFPTVTLPYEVFNKVVKEGDEIEVVDINGEPLGKYKVTAVLANKQFKTQQIKVQMPSELAVRAISFKVQADTRNLLNGTQSRHCEVTKQSRYCEQSEAVHSVNSIQIAYSDGKRSVVQTDKVNQPIDTDDSTMICLCERVSVNEVRDLIKKGITDINQIKAITRLGMGACGSKTCDVMIRQLLRQEGVPLEEVTANTRRPVFVEVLLEKFAKS
jgi:bacterioferritin-associated ferredoxin/Fe-S-cluster-containing hydrogenase component 2